MGFDALRWLWRYFLGAVIVIPIWLVMATSSAQEQRQRALAFPKPVDDCLG